MNILINPKNLMPNDSWMEFRKVRAIIENEFGCFAISSEGGKYIFPGGKCDKDEDELLAIQREIKEEMGIDFELSDFHKIFVIESMYDDAVDYRTQSIRPRHTITTYYYTKTNSKIDEQKQSLTQGEINENFKVCFVDKHVLLEMILEKHQDVVNGHIFDDENQVVAEIFFNKEIGNNIRKK